MRAMWRSIEPGRRAWTGAAWGLFAGTTAILIVKLVNLVAGAGSIAAVLLGVPFGLAYGLAGGLVVFLGVSVIAALPARFRLVLTASLFLLMLGIFSGSFEERVVGTAYVAVSSTVGGAAVGAFFHWRAGRTSRLRTFIAASSFALSIGVTGIGLGWLLGEGDENAPAIDASAGGSEPELELPDPAAPGPHEVKRLFYGSGVDRRRPEYGPRVDLRTKPVDASPFLHGWGGFDGWARSRYWGFDPRSLPVNGRLFYPVGQGPFPLVVAVHGGHPMDDPSEPGYDYLGEHLASRGFVFASVDENFLNGGPWSEISGGLAAENGARAYLVLEHLRAIRGFSDAENGPLHGKVDTSRVALVGHSKGGEAITLAALFNRLHRFPDNANIRFDFDFGIKALIALSTTDKQYQPAGAGTRIDDMDYLALQGSNDGDVEYFQGMQQYERVTLTGAAPHIKAGVYIHGANHGQWNRVWGRYDKTRFPKRLYFNRRPILPPAAQERVAKVYVSAFLAASLAGDRSYLPFLRDHRIGRAFLPETIYVTRYDDSTRRYVSRFDEDVDVTTTTMPGGRAHGEHLTIWREQPPGPGSLWSALEGRTVYLGWDASLGKQASYTIELPPDLDPTLRTPGAALVFSLADAHEPASRTARLPHKGPRPPINLTLELVGAAGRVARVPLDRVRKLQPQLEANVWKAGMMTRRRREIVFQTFEVPLDLITEATPDFALEDLRAVRFVFDRTPAGVVVLDDFGFAPPSQ